MRKACLCLLLASGFSAHVAGAPQWSVQDLAFQASKDYGNPYLEAALTAEFSGPSGARVEVKGFWDGGRTFKVRWTPALPGKWAYVTRSADPGLNGKRGEVHATPPDPGQHGCLRRDVEYPYSFVFDDGARCFLFGNTYYALTSNAMAGDRWKAAVDNTRAKGMNKIRFSLYRGPGDRHRTGFGFSPAFVEEDFDRPNLPHWRKLDEVVRYLASRGIIADIILFQREDVDRVSREQSERYLRYAIARYAAFPNVIWCLQNEWEYTKKPKELWNAMGELASREDPWARRGEYVRGLSVHQQTRYDFQLFGAKWFSHAIVQLGVRNRGKAHRGGDEWSLAGRDLKSVFRNGDDWGNFSILYNWGHNVPVVNDEYGYIGEPADETEPRGPGGGTVRYSRDKHRRTMWGIYVAGGYGSAGDKNEYDDGRPYVSANWHDEPEFDDIKRLVDFFTAKGFEYWKMAGHNELVKTGERVYVLAEPGRQYIVYAAAGGRFSIDLAAGGYEARRFDPRTGEDLALDRVSGPAIRSFSAPDNRDWVLHLRMVK